MRWNILIGGKAGQGIDALSQLVSALLVKKGLYVFNYRDYQSLIRGGHNFNVVCGSDKPVASHDEQIDMLVAFDENTYTQHKGQLKENTVLTSSNKIKGEHIDISKLGKAGNVAFAAAVAKIIGFTKEELLDVVKKQFKEKYYEQNKKAAEEYYDKEYKTNVELPKGDNTISIKSGSEAVADGAIKAGVQRYYGYPMTPSTGVLTQLALKQDHKELLVFTYENEIACVNAAIGSSYAGKRTMTGTSGGGFDLMSEGMSFAGMAELPLVINLAQRPGPGTGVPTYTCQADMNIALYAGHGEFPRVVIAPGDVAEGYEKTQEAVYLAEKYSIPVVILTDKHMLESMYTQEMKESKLKVPPRKEVPGQKIVKKSSYEHDETGATTESAEITSQNADKRKEKAAEIAKEKVEMYKTYGEGETLIVGWGSTKGAVLDAELEGVKYLHIMYLEPFPDISKEIEAAKKVIVIEQNATGQLAELMEKKLLRRFDKRILK